MLRTLTTSLLKTRPSVQPQLSLIYLQQQRFAGHNKWSKVKHTKGAKDAKKSILYSKISLEIVSSARSGGTDPSVNNKLAAVLNRAKAASMPKDSIENALKKATDKNKADLENVLYECVGPGGMALIVEALTDKKSRTVKEVKEVLNRVGGSVSSVGYLFDKKGRVAFTPGESNHSFEQIMDVAIDSGVEDIEEDQDNNLIEVTCEFSELNTISKKLMNQKYEVQQIEATYIPTSIIELKDRDTIELVTKCLEDMEDLEDVVKVHSNVVIAQD
ncbi:hypothetical protein G6F29_010611 [Rhizopus arrhizus]|uniref:DUF28-domain-containing protein n=1 Tax=Rhizopus oryzae TaxID=64495 RepID=A0A9P7BP76_RHIOR|nr:hypothetical protein G6F20_010245 [Rhizopus arrhizus]KAG1414240.1 hypothetical protein G6F58_007051 [Rhizopus delemar]KAG0824780.1 hypothetical protein G6F19_010159 [Rhizopus arrhizus]KAG0849881.1 hypothetical protein G6F17_010364 [Rhizopus arrhizus]KAG0874974.1 hypothetical protein G6F15_010463 [Rhizopus arrhizus]